MSLKVHVIFGKCIIGIIRILLIKQKILHKITQAIHRFILFDALFNQSLVIFPHKDLRLKRSNRLQVILPLMKRLWEFLGQI